MSEGIHIPAIAVRIAAGVAVLGLLFLVKSQLPEARRYLKMEAM